MKLCFEHLILPLGEFELKLHGEFTIRLTALLGPSGAGKTSFLEILAGLRQPRHGRILLDDRVLCDKERACFLPTRHRRIGYVPQDLALFPHLTVQANLIYGLRSDEGGKKIRSVCDVLEVGGLLSRMPLSLSGGEKQRVAFARAILADPELLLLDEPLSSLDQPLKERIFPYIMRMRDELKIPMLYVTHSTQEAALLASEVLMLEHGRIIARGVPGEILPAIFHHEGNSF